LLVFGATTRERSQLTEPGPGRLNVAGGYRSRIFVRYDSGTV
jgi:hypothetical protein